MKKLMIAAAAAAMIGGAWASTVAYDFSATVKTTNAKQNKTTLKCNLGKDTSTPAVWWYQDGVFTPSMDKNGNPIANYLDFGTYEKVVKLDKNNVGTLQVGRLDNDGKAALAAALEATYCVPEIYKGKQKWCATFSYTSTDCYRIAGSRKLAWSYTIDDCCADPKFVEASGNSALNLWPSLIYRFGNGAYAQSKKVEFAGWIGKASFHKSIIAQKQSSASATVLHLAGQGTWATLKDSNKATKDGISSISGNIVGVLPNAICDVCCGAKNWDLVYTCDGTDDSRQATYAEGWETAAFGTFTLKFNAKNSSL